MPDGTKIRKNLIRLTIICNFDKLKIVHLNTYEGNGGAGRACLRLNHAINTAGAKSEVMVYFQFHESKTTGTFSKSPFQKAKAVFQIMAERYLAQAFVKAVKTPFSLQWFGRSVIKHPAVKNADIIHLHWINFGFLSMDSQSASSLKSLNSLVDVRIFVPLKVFHQLKQGSYME